MTTAKSDPSETSASTNECPDVRPRLVADGQAMEKKYPWMVLREISTRSSGNCNVLLVAPHGFPGDDDNVEILTCLLAEKEGLDCYAVVNNRKYNRKTNSEKFEFWQDLNNPDQAVECDDFWNPLMKCTKLILSNYSKPPLILFIHGIGNLNADEYLGANGDFALGAGYEGARNLETATASEGLITKLQEALTKRIGLAKDGVHGYGATQMVPMLFRKGVQNEKVDFRKEFPDADVEAVQLEIRCKGYRDTVENIEKLAKGLKEILTDTSEGGFQDYFTRERKVLDGITIDEEFKSLIPPLSDEELRQLEENILAAGRCHDPLRVWRNEEKLILLDGHHRRDICRKHGLPNPAVVEVALESREEAIRWIAEHQIGRRNLKPFQRIELAHRMEPAIRELARKRQQEAHKQRGREPKAKDNPELHTDAMMGKVAGVSPRTYRNAREVITAGSEELIRKCREGQISVDAAFRQVQKPSKERSAKRVASSAPSAAQASPEPIPELVPELQPVPSSVPVAGSDEPVPALDTPPPCDVIVFNIPWESPSTTLDRLVVLPVSSLAKADCMIWLRATNSRIRQAYSLLQSWGFEPKTLFTWIKQEAEPAEWLDDRSEHYVVAVKGNPGTNAERKFSTSLNTIKAPDHAGKPLQFYSSIERYCLGEMRLEVFADTERGGWIAWNPWHPDRVAKGIRREEPSAKGKGESSEAEKEKASKEGPKRKAASTKKSKARRESE